jgi:hypothetical protein
MKTGTSSSLSLRDLIREGSSHRAGSLLSFDPGETTGWAFFADAELKCFGQTGDLKEIRNLILDAAPDRIVYEAFRLYPWKSAHLSWSNFPAAEVIGVIKSTALEMSIPVIEQSASQGKTFFTDQKLKILGIDVGKRHARDAIRHAAYYLVFGKE